LSQCGGDRHSKTIDILTDDVLLDIFDFCRHDDTLGNVVWGWHLLVHVCRRWRQIVFESPRRLDIKVRCTYGTSIQQGILIWPNIPIALVYSSFFFDPSPDDEENIIIALEHSDRLGHLHLKLTDQLLGKLAPFIQKPFPVLTDLILYSKANDDAPVLPAEFLRGSAPSLQTFDLTFISFPAWPTLLSSARDLVSLSLITIPPTDYISPETLVACLAALPRLKTAAIGFQSNTPHPDQMRRHPITRTVLHALTRSYFKGACEYLEDFAARIDCPRLDSFYINYLGQLVDLQATQLIKFFEYLIGPEISPFTEAKIHHDSLGVSFRTHRPTNHPGWDWRLARTTIGGCVHDREASPVAQMLSHLSPMLSTVVKLESGLRDVYSSGEPDVFAWLHLFHQLSAVRALCVSEPPAERIAHALESFTKEMAVEVLPCLGLIYLEGWQYMSSLDKFTAARQLSGHPVTVVQTVKEFDRRLECYLEK
jgi:hypothetical protein